MITLWIVRHGQTDWNAQKRYQGHSDIPLNALGEQQAAQVAKRLKRERLHAVISDDLQRTRDVAIAIAAHHKLTPQVDPNLRDANFGVFEGLRYKDVIDQYPTMAKAWFADPNDPPDDGESLSQLLQRIRLMQQSISRDFARKRVVLVGSDGALRLLITDLLGMPATDYWRFNLDFGSLSRVNIYPGGAILVRLNDVSHLV